MDTTSIPALPPIPPLPQQLHSDKALLAADALWCLVAGSVLIAAAEPISKRVNVRPWAARTAGAATIAWGGLVGSAAVMDDFVVSVASKWVASSNTVAAAALAARTLSERGGTLSGRFGQGITAVQIGAFAALQFRAHNG